MTNERAINVIKDIKNYYNDKSEYYEDGYIGFDKEDNEAIDRAIKALEAQPFINKPCISEGVCREDKIQVLDKIRAEIERRKKNSGGEPSRDLAFNVCLQIIDKYKAESEVQGTDGR